MKFKLSLFAILFVLFGCVSSEDDSDTPQLGDEITPVQPSDETTPVQPDDEIIPVQPDDEIITVQPDDEIIPVQPGDEIITVQLDTPESVLQTERGLFVTNVTNGGDNSITLELGGYIALINSELSSEPILLPTYSDEVQLYHPKGLIKDTDSDAIFVIDVDQLVKVEYDGLNYKYTSYDLSDIDQSKFNSKGSADLAIVGDQIFIASFMTGQLIKLNKNLLEPATFVVSPNGFEVMSFSPTGLVSFNQDGTDYIIVGDFPGNSMGSLVRFEVTENGDFTQRTVISSGNYDGLYVDQGKLYAGFWGMDGLGDPQSGAGIQEFDLTDPMMPLEKTTPQEAPSDVSVVGSEITISDFNNSVIVKI